mmetsp:Transcript_9195/g.25842  ORF Transcript_9195/g.25842 Transcript_9195/m.25842 type:complete len:355 (+) Transcript_9195:2739-3803(+)
MPPGTPSGNGRSSASAAHARSMAASPHAAPTRASSVRRARFVVGAMPPKPVSTERMVQPPSPGESSTRMQAFTMEMSSSRRRACLKLRANSNSPVGGGTRTRQITSEGDMSTVRYRLKNSRTSTSRGGQPHPATVTVAPSAISTGFMSEMGLAVARFPARAATLRICPLANQRSMSSMALSHENAARGRSFRASSMKCSTEDSVTAPPITSAPSASKQSSCSSLTAAVDICTGYSSFLNFVSMPISVLPDTSLAVGSCFFRANKVGRLLGLYHVTCLPMTFKSAVGLARKASGKGTAKDSLQDARLDTVALEEEHTWTPPSPSGPAAAPPPHLPCDGTACLSHANVLPASRMGR